MFCFNHCRKTFVTQQKLNKLMKDNQKDFIGEVYNNALLGLQSQAKCIFLLL
jgi:hypothetical protein